MADLSICKIFFQCAAKNKMTWSHLETCANDEGQHLLNHKSLEILNILNMKIPEDLPIAMVNKVRNMFVYNEINYMFIKEMMFLIL